MLSTKYPLTILVMELSEQLRQRKASLELRWLSREKNTEADELTNCIYTSFKESLRVALVPSELRFLVLNEIQQDSNRLYALMIEEKATKKRQDPEMSRGKLPIKQKLKQADPW